jgi:hypothetical protein
MAAGPSSGGFSHRISKPPCSPPNIHKRRQCFVSDSEREGDASEMLAVDYLLSVPKSKMKLLTPVWLQKDATLPLISNIFTTLHAPFESLSFNSFWNMPRRTLADSPLAVCFGHVIVSRGRKSHRGDSNIYI